MAAAQVVSYSIGAETHVPIFRAPQIHGSDQESHVPGLHWTLVAGPKFDDILDSAKIDGSPLAIKAHMVSNFPIVATQRINMLNDPIDILSGGYLQGKQSPRSMDGCSCAIDEFVGRTFWSERDSVRHRVTGQLDFKSDVV